MSFLVQFINLLALGITLLVILSSILSFIMSPYHPVRRAIDQIVQPFLVPIQRIVPPMGAIDFSPLILIILVQLLAYTLNRLLGLL